jgi:membrane-associated phospholipid phosphatase
MNKIKAYYNQYFRAEDKIILVSLLIAASLGLGFIISNALGAKYAGNQFVSWGYYIGFPIMSGLFLLSLYARELSPRMSLITWTYTIYFFQALCIGTLVYGIQLTPFHPIDPLLVKIDQIMGFNQTQLLDFTYQHHHFATFLNQCYGFMTFELAAIPLVLAIMMQKRAINVLFLTMMFTFIVGTLIYYFFPTTAPASMFSNVNFATEQHDTFRKFYEIHHHLPITTNLGGLIAFPSFHVVWAVLFAYAFKDKKYLLVPMTVLNSFIILSTVMLGWHYLIDVFAGIAIAVAAIQAAEWVYRKYIATEKERIIAETSYTAAPRSPALSSAKIQGKQLY